jgi:hypothetical protein
VKGDDCRPNKALRTTIKVFLRKKGIEREASRKKDLLDKIVTPSAASPNPTTDKPKHTSPSTSLAISAPDKPEVNGNSASAPIAVPTAEEPRNDLSTRHALQASLAEDQMDIPRPSIEVGGFFRSVRAPTNPPQSANDGSQQDVSHEKALDADGVQEQKDTNQLGLERGQHDEEPSHPIGAWGLNTGAGSLVNNSGTVLDGMNAGFPTMDFSGTSEFGQMMQFMPNGMQAGGMAAFPNMMSGYPSRLVVSEGPLMPCSQ